MVREIDKLILKITRKILKLLKLKYSTRFFIFKDLIVHVSAQ
jgi:hypothetical protein